MTPIDMHGGALVVPAHNEEAVIEQTLHRLLAELPVDVGVVVACNGCIDATASRARSVSDDRVVVIEIERPSKVAALNAADRLLGDAAWPRLYVDADVLLTGGDAARVLAALRSTVQPRAAAPRLVIDDRHATVGVKLYEKAWRATGYRQGTVIGSGVYGLNRAGRMRYGDMPGAEGATFADDAFVAGLFAEEERILVGDARFEVIAPRNLRILIRRASRIRKSNRELRADGGGESSRRRADLLRMARRPGLWLPLLVYLYVSVSADVRAGRSPDARWFRDDTPRNVLGRE